MTYDSFCAAAALTELEGLIGAHVGQVHQPDRLAVVVTFTGGSPSPDEQREHRSRRLWLFQSDPRWTRAHEITFRAKSEGPPPGFCMLLRKHLGGARLAAVEQPGFDRILRLTFRSGEERWTLVHEIMGRHSNLLLLDEHEVILGAVKQIPPSQSSVRAVLPGIPYSAPPGQRVDPRSLAVEQLRAVLAGVVTPAEITARLNGWGAFAAREALAEAVMSVNAGLAEAVLARMDRVARRDFDPKVWLDDAGQPTGFWAFPSLQLGSEGARSYRTVSRACEAYFSYQENNAAADALRKSLLGQLARAIRTAQVQLAEANAALDGLDQTEALRITGEILAAHAGKVERGAESITLPNWYDPEGGTLVATLDPEMDGRENAERYFRRYRRATAAAEAALDRIPTLEERARSLQALRTRVTEAPAEELTALREELRSAGIFREQAAQAGGKSPLPEFPPGVRIKRVTVGDWELLYGENATGNDHLTTRLARPGDLWLHARAVTGSHVVVRGVSTLERLPAEVLREAARIAAAHSSGRHASVVAVDYTFRRYVRKPRRSAPGAVVYTHEKTIHVSP